MGSFRDLLSDSLGKCREKGEDFGRFLASSLEFDIPDCGQYSLSLSGKTSDGKTTAELGTVTVSLPQFARLAQVEEGFDSANLAFDEEITCFPDRTYTVKCGRATFSHVREDETIVVKNLFPGLTGEVYTCTYFAEDTKGLLINASLHTKNYPFRLRDYSPFSANDVGMFLVNDSVAELLAHPNISVSIRASEWIGKENFTNAGHDAVTRGLTGLRPSSPYVACLTVEQVEGTCTFECQKRKWCHEVTTLPRMSPRQSSSPGLWILGSAVVLLLTLMMILLFVVWIRLNAIGAPDFRLSLVQLKNTQEDYQAAFS